MITICFEITTAKEYTISANIASETGPNTTFVIPQHPETSTQTQLTSACDASVSEHDFTSYVSDQSTKNYVNADANNYDDSH